MDEEIDIINSSTRNEKIKNFFINNKKSFITVISIIVIVFIGYFSFNKNKKRNKQKLANQYNSAIFNYENNKKDKVINELIYIINKKDTTYSPLALYFILDNDLIDKQNDINNLFDVLIDKTNLELEIKNLIIYKKALYNSDFVTENQLIEIINPVINSESIWKSHGLYLLAEYFYSKNEKIKAKEFFNKILDLTNSNTEIKLQSQKRLNRDLSE